VIGCKWEEKGNGPKFVHHFLPTIAGHEAKEDIDINDQLQKYFEFAGQMSGYPSHRVTSRKSFLEISSLLLRFPILFSGNYRLN